MVLRPVDCLLMANSRWWDGTCPCVEAHPSCPLPSTNTLFTTRQSNAKEGQKEGLYKPPRLSWLRASSDNTTWREPADQTRKTDKLHLHAAWFHVLAHLQITLQ